MFLLVQCKLDRAPISLWYEYWAHMLLDYFWYNAVVNSNIFPLKSNRLKSLRLYGAKFSIFRAANYLPYLFWEFLYSVADSGSCTRVPTLFFFTFTLSTSITALFKHFSTENFQVILLSCLCFCPKHCVFLSTLTLHLFLSTLPQMYN